MNGFEGDDFRLMPRKIFQQLFQMFQIVVPKNVFRRSTVADALNHRGVIATIRENLTPVSYTHLTLPTILRV